MGLGNGFLFCPCVALLSTYFQRKRSLAIGIAACGSATGGMVYPGMVRALLPGVGFGWTMRAIGFIQAGTLAFAIVFLKPRVKPRKTGSLVEWAAFKELEYVFYAGGSFLVSRTLTTLPTAPTPTARSCSGGLCVLIFCYWSGSTDEFFLMAS